MIMKNVSLQWCSAIVCMIVDSREEIMSGP